MLSSLTKLSGDASDSSSQGSSGATTLDLGRLDLLKYVNLDQIPDDKGHTEKSKETGVQAV